MAWGGRRRNSGRKKRPRKARNPSPHQNPNAVHGGRRPGSGRKKNSRTQRSKSGQWCIYVVQEADNFDVCKIGITCKPWQARIGGLQTGNWRKLSLAAKVDLRTRNQAAHVEEDVQRRLAERRIIGEWFRIGLEAALTAIGQAIVQAAIEHDAPIQKELFS